METRRLGSSGLALSELSLGTLTWGRDTDQHEASELLSVYLESGGRTLDVPSDYGSSTFAGRSALVGTVVREKVTRDEITLIAHSGVLAESTAPLIHNQVSIPGVEVSRRNLSRSLDHLLTSLQTDFVDLWVVHGPRRGVSHQEIASTLQSAITSGRAAYVGLSGFDLWDFGAISAHLSLAGIQVAGLAGPLSLLASQGLDLEIPHAVEQGSGYVALSPLAHGVLTAKYRHSTPPDSRAATSHLGRFVKPFLGPTQSRIVEAVAKAAEGLDVAPGNVALAWTLSHGAVASAVTGPRTVRQLETLLKGSRLKLQRELREVLTEVATHSGS